MKPTIKNLTVVQAERKALGILDMEYKQLLRVETQNKIYGTLTKDYMIGSVASYFIEYNQCPIRGVEDAKNNGHALYWLNPIASFISNNPRPLDKVRHWVQSDQIVGRNSKAPEDCIQIWFQGRLFNVEHTANDNLGMVEVHHITDAQVKKLEAHRNQ